METSTMLMLMGPLSGVGLDAVILMVFRKAWMRKRNKAETKRRCLDEARRLVLKGAPHNEVVPWLNASRSSEVAKKLCHESLYGYGLAF